MVLKIHKSRGPLVDRVVISLPDGTPGAWISIWRPGRSTCSTFGEGDVPYLARRSSTIRNFLCNAIGILLEEP